MIDITSLRQSYEKREIAEVRWIDGRDNPADAVTNGAPCDCRSEYHRWMGGKQCWYHFFVVRNIPSAIRLGRKIPPFC